MAKRRCKKRTHVGANQPTNPAAVNGHADPRDPKSMVIRIGAGEVGTSVSQLATDVRRVMEPGTASRLRERKANRLRDYVTMCGPLGVTHLLLFSRSTSGNVNLRLATTPRGPTFHFRIERYSLAKDVRKAQRRPKGGGKEYITPPLLVMNNFTTANADAHSKVPKHLESLVTTAFQSLFPPINPQATPLKSIRRVLLLNREKNSEEEGSFVVNFRHYAITTKVTGISKPLERLKAAERLVSGKKGRKGGLPNLNRLQDIADFLIGGENGDGYVTDGGTTGSEADTDAEVDVLETAPRKVLSNRARATAASKDEGGGTKEAEGNVERRAVKLVELGPRMRLRMTKVEEGLCSGKTMWHEYVEKSVEEMRELERRWDERRKAKEARKKQQKENVDKKQRAKEDGKKASGGKGGNEQGEEMDLDGAESDMYEYHDDSDSEGSADETEEQVKAREGEEEDISAS